MNNYHEIPEILLMKKMSVEGLVIELCMKKTKI